MVVSVSTLDSGDKVVTCKVPGKVAKNRKVRYLDHKVKQPDRTAKGQTRKLGTVPLGPTTGVKLPHPVSPGTL